MIKFKRHLIGFPEEIVERMTECQAEQGNKIDVSVFEKNARCCKKNGGFDWSNTKECYWFWYSVISGRKFDLFFEKYPKS